MHTQQIPLVSAVIPTRNRPVLVLRAVKSVLLQTHKNLECIVVIDGPDAATVAALQQVTDPRLHVIALEQNVGGNEARNTGIRAGKGEWIGLLDDDDEWLPNRVEKQLAAISANGANVDMAASKYFDYTPEEHAIRPMRFPAPGENISDFLWGNVSPLGGIVGFPQTSTWLVRRSLLLEVPFTKGLKALQDLDWLLNAYFNRKMNVAFVEEPLTIFHNEDVRNRVTKAIDWRFSYNWAMQNRRLFTPKAFAAFLIIYCINPASQQGEPLRERMRVFKQCFQLGKMDGRLMILFVLYNSVYTAMSKFLSRRAKAMFLYKFKLLFHRSKGNPVKGSRASSSTIASVD